MYKYAQTKKKLQQHIVFAYPISLSNFHFYMYVQNIFALKNITQGLRVRNKKKKKGKTYTQNISINF